MQIMPDKMFFCSMPVREIFKGLLILWLLVDENLTLSLRCSDSNCKPPNCRCPSHAIPGGFLPEEVPQMVLITFDDAVNWDNWDYYLRLFPPNGSRQNPNGCPAAATYFVSHNFTDYCMLQKLHARGQEIADHSVTHRLPHAWWENASDVQIADEILGQRKHLMDLADIPMEAIKGWRSPFLQPTGDAMFEVLYKNNFTYDATLTYPFPRNVYSPVMWPFTLDYAYTLVCNIEPCPKKTYPGFWIIPVVVMMDYREHLPCAYVDHCTNAPRNQYETFEMLWKNFLRNYRTNRAPLYVNLHSVWLETDFHIDAMDEFIEKLLGLDDVYILPVHKAIEWMRKPVALSQIKNFEPWKCQFEPNQEDKNLCSFTFRPHSTTRTTRRPVISPRPKYHNTKQEYDDEYPHEDNMIDHNGFNRTDRRQQSSDLEDRSHRHHTSHAHRPWFLKNSASTSSTTIFIPTIATCLVTSVVIHLTRTGLTVQTS